MLPNNNTYEFYGVDAKTEWRVGLIFGGTFIIVWGLSFYILYLLSVDKMGDHPSFSEWNRIMTPIFLGSMGIGSVAGTSVLKFLGKGKSKKWTITMLNDRFVIGYGEINKELLFDDIIQINVLGNVGFRYLTFKTNFASIKMRVGSTWLTPFSKAGDVEILDSFVRSKLMPFLRQKFELQQNKLSPKKRRLLLKILRISPVPQGFPNLPDFLGIYKRKNKTP